MRTIIVLSAIFSFVLAAVPNDPIPIVRQEIDVNFDGNFKHSFEGGNGIAVQEVGTLKNAGSKDNEIQEVQGSFTYTDNDGITYSVRYTANENGFQPEGSHFPVAPTPPPIPEAILKALEWNAKHPEEDNLRK